MMAREMTEEDLKKAREKQRERKFLIVGAIIAVPILLFYYGVKPLNASLDNMREQLYLERSALVRERAAIAAAKQNPRLQLVADSLMKITRERLFSGADDVEASAELGSYIGGLAGENHFLLKTATTGAPPKTKSNVRTLTEVISGESDLQGILEFLQALEQGPKLLRVSRVDLSRPKRDADDIETVEFAATITGYALPPEVVAPVKTVGVKDSTAVADSAASMKAANGDKRGGNP